MGWKRLVWALMIKRLLSAVSLLYLESEGNAVYQLACILIYIRVCLTLLSTDDLSLPAPICD